MLNTMCVLGSFIAESMKGNKARLNITQCAFSDVYVMRKVRIRTILGFSWANFGSQLCTANPGFAQLILRKPRPRLALSPPLVRSSQASELFASEGSCRSFLVCIRTRYTLRCVSEPRSHAFSLLASRNSHTHTCNQERHAAPLALANSLLACKDQAKVRKVCVSSRLLRGAKNADLAQHRRFVCAIPGLLRTENPSFAQENP